MSWIPKTYKQWLKEDNQHIPQMLLLKEEVIRRNVDWLIEQCYEPDSETGARVSDRRLSQLGLRDTRKEAINWGDLGCVSVKQFTDGSWDVIIEEAQPDSSVLCNYIQGWLSKWGWNARVRAEW